MSKNKKKTAAPKQQAATIQTIEKTNRVEFIVVNILCLFIFLAFGYIGIMSFFETSVFDQTNIASEIVIFEGDNILLNLFFTALFIALLFWLRRFYDFFAKVNIQIMEIGLAVWAVTITSTSSRSSWVLCSSRRSSTASSARTARCPFR